MEVYNVNRSCGGEKDIYPSISADEYVDKLLPFIEKLYNMIKYS